MGSMTKSTWDALRRSMQGTFVPIGWKSCWKQGWRVMEGHRLATFSPNTFPAHAHRLSWKDYCNCQCVQQGAFFAAHRLPLPAPSDTNITLSPPQLEHFLSPCLSSSSCRRRLSFSLRTLEWAGSLTLSIKGTATLYLVSTTILIIITLHLTPPYLTSLSNCYRPL